MTRETKEELLLTMLLLGLRLLEGSFESLAGAGARAGLLSPKVGLLVDLKKEAESVVGVKGSSWTLEGS